MKGNFHIWIKRWVLAALVFTLALSLTSCGKGRKNLLGGDWQTCDDTSQDGAGWQFDVSMEAVGGSYKLHIYTQTVTADANGNPPTGQIFLYGPPAEPLANAALIPGREIVVPVSADQLNYFNTLVIQQYMGTAPLDAQTNTTTFCELPQVMDQSYN